MFVAAPERCRVVLGVVAYGVTDRLADCLASLMHHRSAVDFGIVCVVNPRSRDAEPVDRLPAGVRVVEPSTNLGWPGGLHAARAEAGDAEHLVWVQDDMVVLDGWLDALVEAADAHPEAAAFGSLGVDEHGHADAFAGGAALPPDDIDRWNDTDTTRERLPDGPATYDWVTSKGMLARLRAWDEVGGPDPALFPLNHVDKEYGSHLRCHGWTSMLVPGARLRHAGDSSSPGALRVFLAEWRSPALDARWGGVLAALGSGNAAPVEHDCRAADRQDLAAVERLVGDEAARMLVPFNRFVRAWTVDLDAKLGDAWAGLEWERAERAATQQGWRDDVERLHRETAASVAEAEAARAEAEAARAEARRAQEARDAALAAVDELRRSTSWRLTRPVRALGAFRTGRRGAGDGG